MGAASRPEEVLLLAHRPEREDMRELTRTNDVALISFLEHRMREEGIAMIVLDQFTSIIEGSLGAIPRRVMVSDDDHTAACLVLAEAESLGS